MEEKIRNIINDGESITVEFKEGYDKLPKSLFETVCSFLNTYGGYIILGVDDKKNIIGVNKDKINELKKDYTSLCNNSEKINPTIFSELNEIIIDDKTILYTYIKPNLEIYKTNNKIFIRNHDGDFDITNNITLTSKLYNRKRKIYDEDKIYQNINIDEDLRTDLIEKARKLATIKNSGNHPWANMTNLELLKSANLYRKDETGEGITLAGIMLFGKDNVIWNVNPHCRTDCLYRVDDLDRYDDRDIIETNLIDMYDRMEKFIHNYTMDRFALDKTSTLTISPRNVMSRELVINSLMHRDYLDGHTSRIIIYKDKIISENPNLDASMENLTIDNYRPYQKNPTIAKFFREIGYADELGSGIRKITENSIIYSGKKPIFEDKEMFTVTIPLLRDKTNINSTISTDNKVINKLKDNKFIKKISNKKYNKLKIIDN